jgi:hypothetical protein
MRYGILKSISRFAFSVALTQSTRQQGCGQLLPWERAVERLPRVIEPMLIFFCFYDCHVLPKLNSAGGFFHPSSLMVIDD